MPLGTLISAGVGFASKLFGASKAKKEQRRQSQLEYERQKEFATKGIQWKVNDATKAGIHPLYPLGS